jgi:alkylhydroperoxidase family enzyme
VLGAYAALARYGGSTTDLEPRLRLLATQLAAERSRCRWCIDKGRHLWREAHLPVDVLRALPRYETSPLFSIRERATLRFTEAITHCTATGGDGPLLEPLAFVRQHLSEPEIAAVTAAVAEMHFFNPITGELGADADGEPSPAPTCRSAWGAPIGTSLRSFWL